MIIPYIKSQKKRNASKYWCNKCEHKKRSTEELRPQNADAVRMPKSPQVIYYRDIEVDSGVNFITVWYHIDVNLCFICTDIHQVSEFEFNE